VNTARDRWASFMVAPGTLLRWHRELVKGAVNDMGIMAAQRAGSMLAVPKDVTAAIEEGFRERFTQLVLKSLGR